jgi:hypothetical protein
MRITGKQLRRIIQEEVARMINEEGVADVNDMKGLVDAVTQLENAVQEQLGVTLGAAVSQFVAAAKGQKNAVFATIKSSVGDLPGSAGFVQGGGEELHGKIVAGVAKAVLAANGKKNAVTLQGYPVAIAIDGKMLTSPGFLGSAADMSDLASRIGRFMLERM